MILMMGLTGTMEGSQEGYQRRLMAGHQAGMMTKPQLPADFLLKQKRNVMTPTELKTILLWSLAVNYGLLLIWFSVFAFGHDTFYQFHRRWFLVSVETFDTIHYSAMAPYKIGLYLLNLVPLIALLIIGA